MNYCFINPQGGPVQVILKIDSGLLAGALFRHLEFPNGHVQIRDEFKVKTGASGEAEFVMNDLVAEMENELLTWLIQSCSPIGQVDHGDMKIEFFQDDVKCETKNPVFYRLQDVPQCAQGDDPVKREGMISFRYINPLHTKNLLAWEEDLDLL
jgi:hypothetical protein